ncbi:ABC transporter substrate-binding protein [Paenibacillus sp. V4I7]|uniref:ABC transporter substrate-binding protein n=1 Tax=Paenibacillus sp. V4I7 TaxID=3042307 RepID=UPI00278557E1|nr:sugar ABC transporter substrate-binding protein [Paenibacillus sp. V4I7]MDQ0901048.1 multiple sugar transport system substrate-binding protein [Paenibacillus sp. V4I7]
MKKNFAKPFVLILSTALLLSACGSAKTTTDNKTAGGTSASPNAQATASNKSAGPVTVRFNMGDGEITKDQIKEFETANPTIKIQREDVDTTKLAAQLATGEAPDIIRMTGVNDLPSYVIRGIAMDLTKYIDTSTVIKKDDFVPTVDVYRFDGKVQGQGPIYGIPKDFSSDFSIWINKKLFAAAGVAIPSETVPMTYSQLFDLAKKLTIKKGDTITQYGLSGGKGEADLPFLMDYLLSKGVRLSTEDNSKIDFTKPEVKQALQLWVDGVKGNYGPNQVNQDKAAWGGESFLADKLAMFQAGYWFSGVLRGDEKAKTHLDDYVMLPAPIADGGTRVSPTGSATGAIINKATKHPNEAWKVYEWFFGGKPAEDRAKSGWGVPAYKHLLAMIPQETAFDKKTYAVLQDELKYSGKFIEMNPYLLNGDTLLKKQLTPVYFGKATLDDAMIALNKDANKIIEESKSAASSK